MQHLPVHRLCSAYSPGFEFSPAGRLLWKTAGFFYLFLGLIFAGLSSPAFAAPVDRSLAVQAATHWLGLSPEPMGKHAGKIGKGRTFYNAAGEPIFHVIELQPAGFVVTSADDELEPVIAFSHEGQFDGRVGMPLFDILNRDTEGRMRYLRNESAAKRTGFRTRSKEKGKWGKLVAPLAQATPSTNGTDAPASVSAVNDLCVAPMIQSQWNQSFIYTGATKTALFNYYTPPHGAGDPDNYYSGCTATAWAQIMRFHQWPTLGVGTQSFPIKVDGADQSMSLRGGDGAGGPYDWANMVLIPGSGITPQQCQAIGALVVDAGVANNMDYEPNASAAYLHSSAIKTVFHYANAAYSSAGLPDALVAIRTNLDAGLPVALSVWGALSGHQVVCDGYGYNMSTPYHHINMGWGGTEDLWYNIPSIAEFSAVEGCTYNIDPTVEGEIISGRVTGLDGKPLAGIPVNITGSTFLTTTTNSSGIFAFKGLVSNTTWTVEPQGGGYVFGPSLAVIATGSSTDNSKVGDRIADFQAGPASQTGNLQIYLTPRNAVTTGVQWQVDDGSWHDSGDIVSGLLSCNHTVAFKTVSGWITPNQESVAVNAGQTTTGLGRYFTAPMVSTLAGSCSDWGSADGTGSAARFCYPCGVAVDGTGNVYVADSSNHTIRKITSGGVVTTFAGSTGVSGTTDGTGSAALFYYPFGVAVDGTGNVYVADTDNHTIRKVTHAGVVSTFAGSPGASGTTDGAGGTAQFNHPFGVAVDGTDNVYVADTENHTIRRITSTGVVTTFAGGPGMSGGADGNGSVARFNNQPGIAVDGSANLYVADEYNHTIRMVVPVAESTPVVTTGSANFVTDASATLTGSVNPSGVSTTALFEYGLTNSYGATATVTLSPSGGSTAQNVSAAISGLLAGMTYHYRIDATNASGMAMGSDATFNTVGLPIVTADTAGSVTSTSATLTGTVNPSGSATIAQFEYGFTAAYGNTVSVTLSPSNGRGAQNVSANISGLQPGTTYHYHLIATNGNGTSQGVDMTFVSAKILPAITWASPTAITYGTALSATQLNAKANVPGQWVYSPSIGTKLPAGNQNLSVTFTPTDSTRYATVQKSVPLTVNKAADRVTLAGLSQTYNGQTRAVTATTVPSGLNVNITYNGSATVPVNAGSYSVLATVVDDNATGSKTGTLVVGKGTQTITFPTPPTLRFGDGDCALTATASSDLPVIYASSAPAVATIVGGNMLHITGAGNVTVTASQTGNSNWNASVAVKKVLAIGKTSQTIGFTAFSSHTVGEADFSPGATATSGLAVTYASASPAVATIVSGKVHLVGKGMAVITASQAGNTSWDVAAPVKQTLTVAGKPQTITFPALPDTGYGTADFTPGATATSALAITYVSSNLAVATIVAGKIHITGVGTTTITAKQAGNTIWAAADDATQTLTVFKGTPVITWANPAAVTYGTALTTTQLNAKASVPGTFLYSPALGSKLPVGVQTLNVTFTPTDTTRYNTATKSVTLTVNKAAATVTLAGLSQTYNGQPQVVTATTVPAGLNVGITYDVSTDAPLNVGSYTVTATILNDSYAGSKTGTLIVAKGTQTISFGSLTAMHVGDADRALTATVSSGMSVTYASSAPTVATIVAGNIHVVGTGTTTITASQTGNTNWNAAAPVKQTLTVQAAQAGVQVVQNTLSADSNAITINAKPYETWKASAFTNPADRDDPAISGELATPAHDGITNLMKYALALDPMSCGTGGLPAVSPQDGYLTLTYRRNKKATDVSYAVQATDYLDEENWQPATTVLSQTDEGAYWLVTVRDTLPLEQHPHRFMRLQVTH